VRISMICRGRDRWSAHQDQQLGIMQHELPTRWRKPSTGC
jgi:hypothetical protein